MWLKYNINIQKKVSWLQIVRSTIPEQLWDFRFTHHNVQGGDSLAWTSLNYRSNEQFSFDSHAVRFRQRLILKDCQAKIPRLYLWLQLRGDARALYPVFVFWMHKCDSEITTSIKSKKEFETPTLKWIISCSMLLTICSRFNSFCNSTMMSWICSSLFPDSWASCSCCEQYSVDSL